jgi:hypothetical protein
MKAIDLPNFKVISSKDSKLNNISVVRLQGEPFQNGYNIGQEFRDEVHTLYKTLFSRSPLSFVRGRPFFHLPIGRKVKTREFEDAFERIKEHIPPEYMDEMRGIADGSGVPLEQIHMAHILPTITEHHQAKRNCFEDADKLFPTTCSVIGAIGDATEMGNVYTVRILDWLRKLNLHERPVVLCYEPQEKDKNVSVGFSWPGFCGFVTGVNDQGISFGEQGWRNTPGQESLDGIPFTFLARDMLTGASTQQEAVDYFRNADRTSSYVYLIASGREQEAQILLTTASTGPEGFRVFNPGDTISDRYYEGEMTFRGIPDCVYSGMFDEVMYRRLTDLYGGLNLESLMQLSIDAASNDAVQTVITKLPRTDSESVNIWVSNAKKTGLVPGQGRRYKSGRTDFAYINLNRILDGDDEIRNVGTVDYDGMTAKEKKELMYAPDRYLNPKFDEKIN